MTQRMQFTPSELAWLLAGRTSEQAQRARRKFVLDDLRPDDAALVATAQTLVARGFATVDGDRIVAQPGFGMLGMALDTTDQWLEMAIGPEGLPLEALVVVSAPTLSVNFILRLRDLGNVEVMVTPPGSHPSQAIGPLATAYLDGMERVSVGIAREVGDERRSLHMARDASTWTLVGRTGVPGTSDAHEPATSSRGALLRDLERLLA